MKKHIQLLVQKQTLSMQQAKEVILGISQGLFNSSEIVCFISLFMMRPITIQELEGFRAAFLELCVPVDLSEYKTLDMCGTGGDGKNTFNISTLASFVVASCDIPVVKHGNYGLSSISGSSNVLEKIGIRFSADEAVIKKCLDQAGITILHAPLFHPAMKTVGRIRKDLGVKTFFNILGPLINPSHPTYQVIGVYNLEVARMYTYLLQQTKTDFSIVHSIDGYDEVSLTTKAKVISRDSEFVVDPTDFKGVQKIEPFQIYGGNTKDEAAQLFVDIISGKGSEAENNVVAMNAAVAIRLVKKCSLEDAFALAKEKLQNLDALVRLKKLQNLCQ
ncbi:anthranilate phosphoribosyltransferase [Flavobacterium agricola]|uniref:Anthranilate phosphoribosyltransferase n=1 Tax=Flavobacterium agricola TaxID=2870839 RepID=A0ABY6M2R3_9FLAO|nr:anthranilate phosphoribosyltransferase [Flavobacterium agricola]UYW01603.1 anthranilate phosphoribosyltransferase [Flavobacterium agricola]